MSDNELDMKAVMDFTAGLLFGIGFGIVIGYYLL